MNASLPLSESRTGKIIAFLFVFALICGGSLRASVAMGKIPASQKAVPLVENGATAYVIYHAEDAPGVVKIAAQEMQRVIALSTGVEIPISSTPGPRMICLGENSAAAEAGLSVKDLPDDSFRIVTQGETIYILGKDSPPATVGWGGTVNRGTLYGAYSFLEKVVDVRWLTHVDEDVPRHESIAVAPMDVTEIPDFAARQFAGTPTGYRDWLTRLCCGGWQYNCGHNWASFPSRAILREHPEYLALQQDKHMAVPEDDKAPFQPKFCTTNPDLVKAYAEGVIEWLEKNPNQRFVSISPSDGGQWCECPECAMYVATDPNTEWGDYGKYKRSVTPLILKFYNEVARIVGEKFPDRFVCGYVYYDFVFPPDPMPEMEPNVALMLAPLQHYGLTRYKPEFRAQFERLCEIWGKSAKYVGYYGASTWMRVGIGAPLGPSLPLLKHTFETLKKNKFVALNYYTLPVDTGGVHNYIAAKLMWNAEADVDALFTDWTNRYYGAAGPDMARLFRLLDREMESAKKESAIIISDYEMTSEIATKVYAKNFWEIEAIYNEALAKADTEATRRRIETFGNSLIILHHVLHEAELLEGAEKSVFYRTPEDYRVFLQSGVSALNTMKGAAENGAITGISVPGKRSLIVPSLLKKMTPLLLDGDVREGTWEEIANFEQGASVADKFTTSDREPAKNPTRVLVAYDSENLYVAFRCMDAAVWAKEKKHDGADIRKDDYVELLFSTEGTNDPVTFWRLGVNPLNTQWDERVQNGKTDATAKLEWQSATSQGEGYWSCEIKIPFKSIPGLTGAPVAASWRVNLLRHEESTGETSAWSTGESGAIDNPAAFGRWTFPR